MRRAAPRASAPPARGGRGRSRAATRARRLYSGGLLKSRNGSTVRATTAAPRPNRGGGTMQWIDEADAVFRGGGVKGLALAGALCGFAEHPTKPIHHWKDVAGASAGAIIACYLATGHDAQQMLELMQNTSFGQFADFPGHNKELGIARLIAEHGMAPGKAFESWFDEVLEGATFGKVRKPPANG